MGGMMSNYSRLLASTVIVFSFIVLGCATSSNTTPTVSRQAAADKAPAKDYISLNLDYPYYKMLFDKVERRTGLPLKNRGEAHITVITPPEFKILSQRIPAGRLQEEAEDFFEQQKPKYTNLCLGHAEKTLGKKLEQVYYVVVESKDLLQFREKLAAEAGLPKDQFDPDLFYPHVTLGFTLRDMHYEDGVIKNTASCPDDLKALFLER